MQLRGELELRIRFHFAHPQFHDFRFKGLIKRTVDFDRVEPAGQELQGMKPGGVGLGIDHTVPVLIGPAGGADARGG